jgi:LCP family protein required for cell wall assembly
MRQIRRTIVPSLLILALLAGLAAIGMWTGIHNLAPRASLRDVLGVAEQGSDSVAWKVAHHQPINVLLLARGGAGNDNPNFTDTIMVVSLRGRGAVVVSLPRFAWVTIPALTTGDVSGKLYSAYALAVRVDSASLRRDWRSPTGAGDLAAATVSALLGLRIDYWAVIEIDGFRHVIDAIGGVRLNVAVALDDPSYPVDDTGHTTHVHIAARDQVLDGDHALEYARSRLTTSESDRSRRQQSVLIATLARLNSLAILPRLLPLIGALQGRLLTNLGVSDARQLARLAGHLDGAHVRLVTVDESNFMVAQPEPGGDEILLPRSGSYTALRHYLADAIRELS